MKTVTIEITNNGICVMRHIPGGTTALVSHGYAHREQEAMLKKLRELLPGPPVEETKGNSRLVRLLGGKRK